MKFYVANLHKKFHICENGILAQTVVGASADAVQLDQVVEGGHLVTLPLLGDGELAEELRGRGDSAEEDASTRYV